MKSLCVVLRFQPMVDPDRPLGGRAIDQWVSDAIHQAFPGTPTQALGPFVDARDFVVQLHQIGASYDELVLVGHDAPFLRPDLLAQLRDLHREYRADYTFADGFPLGLAPEIVRPGILPVLEPWAQDRAGPVDRETLFQLLSVDMNRFDVETHLSPIDLRGRRLSFTADSRRNRLLLDRYVADVSLGIDDFLKLIETTGERARTLPATLHVQIVEGVLQVPSWSPLLQFSPDALERRNALSRAQWNLLLDQALAWVGDVTVLPGFWGEPSLHPEIVGLLADALAKPGLSVCLETSGLGWSSVDLSPLEGATRLHWIVELDSNVPATYQSLRGNGFEEAHGFTQRLIQQFPGKVWPQTVRMKENEGEMEAFSQKWKADAGRVIIQKHNDFGGRLPQSKPSDLSPWKRHACWHLARDLGVFFDGTVVVCRDDFHRTQPLGNLWSDGFPRVWDRGAELFARHLREEWPEVCRNCDEWYTFHF